MTSSAEGHPLVIYPLTLDLNAKKPSTYHIARVIVTCQRVAELTVQTKATTKKYYKMREELGLET